MFAHLCLDIQHIEQDSIGEKQLGRISGLTIPNKLREQFIIFWQTVRTKGVLSETCWCCVQHVKQIW